MAAYRVERDGIVVWVRLTPRSAHDAVEGIATLGDGREVIAARVRAAAEKGTAHAALEVLLAKALRRPKTSVSVIAGATARIKQVRISGEPRALVSSVQGLPRRPAPARRG